jgi:hypothetical protein
LLFKLKKCAIVCEDHVGGLTGVVLAIIAAPDCMEAALHVTSIMEQTIK